MQFMNWMKEKKLKKNRKEEYCESKCECVHVRINECVNVNASASMSVSVRVCECVWEYVCMYQKGGGIALGNGINRWVSKIIIKKNQRGKILKNQDKNNNGDSRITLSKLTIIIIVINSRAKSLPRSGHPNNTYCTKILWQTWMHQHFVINFCHGINGTETGIGYVHVRRGE